jgi:pyruvate dehydrogenase E2 component (dihydrolipoamide acetyltransferase)
MPARFYSFIINKKFKEVQPKMATTIVMPKFGLTMETGIITRWYKQDGDPVKQGEAIFAVETDKMTNDVDAESDGILHIIIPEGSAVPCKQTVAVIAAPGEIVSVLDDIAPEQSEETKGQVQLKLAAVPSAEKGRVWATPKAKKMAAEKQVDLSELGGKGPQGLLTVKDITVALNKKPKATPMAVKTAEAAGISLTAIAKEGRIMKQDVLQALAKPASVEGEFPTRRIRLSAMRKAIAKNMLYSVQTSPTVTFQIKADVSRLAELKASISEEMKVSYTDLLVSIVAKVLMKHSYLNGRIEGEEIVFHDYVNLGVAVALEDGLVVPVIKNAHQKGIAAISSEIKGLAQKAKGGALTMDEMSEGTFTLTNIGMYGIESFTPIINPPESAILGVNAIEQTLIVKDGATVIRPMLKLSLTVDHRIIDGAVAAKFLSDLRASIENPWRMLI